MRGRLDPDNVFTIGMIIVLVTYLVSTTILAGVERYHAHVERLEKIRAEGRR